MSRRIIALVVVCLAVGVALRAQLATDFNPPRANCCLAGTAQSLADQLQDWNQLGRYYAANEELKRLPADPKRVVFMGDSITDIWRLADSFPGKPYVNRGISGQTTAQMLVRMYPDVITLKPAAVVILAGTNDIARNNGPQTIEMIEQNLMAMTELAQLHGIKVILCGLTPISDNPAPPPAAAGQGAGRGAGAPPRRKQSEQRPPADILKLNAWIKDYAAKIKASYVDYYAATVDATGEFKSGYTNDGLHPNTRGYELMAPVVETAIEQTLR
ncbi:MAG TPA: SGNH/GDSL hydrolase family protein [Vicinamibacterales bacterium]|nr:SGNH/GDSL hydrolase family protein [Vicinamibacterales bacterium]